MTSRVEFCQEFHRIGSCIWSLISTGPKTSGLGYAAAAAAECGSASEPFIYLERGFIPLFQDILAIVPSLRNSVCATDIPGPVRFFFRPRNGNILQLWGPWKWKIPLVLVFSLPDIQPASPTLWFLTNQGSRIPQNFFLVFPLHARKSPGFCSPEQREGKEFTNLFPPFCFSSREIKADKNFLPEIAARGKIQPKALQGPCGKSKRSLTFPASHNPIFSISPWCICFLILKTKKSASPKTQAKICSPVKLPRAFMAKSLEIQKWGKWSLYFSRPWMGFNQIPMVPNSGSI